MRTKQQAALWSLKRGVLSCDGTPLLMGGAGELSIDTIASGANVCGIVSIGWEGHPHQWGRVLLGSLVNVEYFWSIAVADPFSVEYIEGSDLRCVRRPLIFLAVRHSFGGYSVLAPMFTESESLSLICAADGSLLLASDAADPATEVKGGAGLVVNYGQSLQKLVTSTVRAIAENFPGVKLVEKRVFPKSIKGLIWCEPAAKQFATSSAEQSLARAKACIPALSSVLIESAWEKLDSSGRLLETPDGMAKSGIARIAQKAKSVMGYGSVCLRYAAFGGPAGVSSELKERYRPHEVYNTPVCGLDYADFFESYPYHTVGIPSRAGLERYLRDVAASASGAGVDAVAVSHEGLAMVFAADRGGRVVLGEELRRGISPALECDCAAPEQIYRSRGDSVVRFPLGARTISPIDRVRSFGAFSGWFGNFRFVDYGPVDSSSEMLRAELAAVALSGGPVVLSGNPDTLAQCVGVLCTSSATVPRFATPCQTLEELPLATDAALVTCAVKSTGAIAVGLFASKGSVRTELAIASIPTLPYCRRYAVYKHQARKLEFAGRGESVALHTSEHGFEVVTVAPIVNEAYAILGISEVYAMAATVLEVQERPDGLMVALSGGGTFCGAFSDRPSGVGLLSSDGRKRSALKFEYDTESGLLQCPVKLPSSESVRILVEF